METIIQIFGLTLAFVTLLIIIFTVIDIHKKIGIFTTLGFSWAIAVIFGSLFGVFLYRFARPSVERTVELFFERR